MKLLTRSLIVIFACALSGSLFASGSFFGSSKPKKPKRPECPKKPDFPIRPSFTYFTRLGVSKKATEDECRKAWQKKIRLVHTEKGGSDASSKEVKGAWTAIKE